MRFTKFHAKAIAQKLEAEIRRGGKHDSVIVRHEGQTIARYGIRRASHETGHAYIPKQLQISNGEAESLANCSLDRNGYFTLLRKKGLLSSVKEENQK